MGVSVSCKPQTKPQTEPVNLRLNLCIYAERGRKLSRLASCICIYAVLMQSIFMLSLCGTKLNLPLYYQLNGTSILPTKLNLFLRSLWHLSPLTFRSSVLKALLKGSTEVLKVLLKALLS